jgi:hypothetical protein
VRAKRWLKGSNQLARILIYALKPCLTLMKSPFAKFRNSDESLKTALRGSAPKTEFPATLHNSIMRAVGAVHREERTQVSGFTMFERFAKIRWLPVIGIAGFVLLGVVIAIHNGPERKTSNSQVQAQISAAFTASQEVVDALPSVTVGPLSDELDKVNQDLDRTAEFLLATLP